MAIQPFWVGLNLQGKTAIVGTNIWTQYNCPIRKEYKEGCKLENILSNVTWL